MTISRSIGLYQGVHYRGPLGRPRFMVMQDPSIEDVATARLAVGEECLIAVRWYHDPQDLSNPLANARQWFYQHQGQMQQMAKLGRVVFSGYNEIAKEQAEAYAAFELERLRLMHEAGYGAGLFNFSVGTPDEETWPRYQRVLEAMTDSDVLLFHEYATDWYDLDNDWHVLRFARPEFRRYIRGKRIAVAEIGADHLDDPGLPIERRGYAGWRRFLAPEQFMLWLARFGELYDAAAQELRADGVTFEGAAAYQAGLPGGDWWAFDVTSIWPTVVSLYADPPPAPEPRPLLPRDETATDPATLAEKVRWWMEEATRHLEAQTVTPDRFAMQIIQDLIALDGGLLYRLENTLKGAR